MHSSFTLSNKQDGQGFMSGKVMKSVVFAMMSVGMPKERVIKVLSEDGWVLLDRPDEDFLWNDFVSLLNEYDRFFNTDNHFDLLVKAMHDQLKNYPIAQLRRRLSGMRFNLWLSFKKSFVSALWPNIKADLKWISKDTYLVFIEGLYKQDRFDKTTVKFLVSLQKLFGYPFGHPPGDSKVTDLDLDGKYVVLETRLAPYNSFRDTTKLCLQFFKSPGEVFRVYKEVSEERVSIQKSKRDTARALFSLIDNINSVIFIIRDQEIIHANKVFTEYFPELRVGTCSVEDLHPDLLAVMSDDEKHEILFEVTDKGQVLMGVEVLSRSVHGDSSELLMSMKDLGMIQNPEELVSYTREQERKRLAHDMHDSLGQLFTASSFHLASLKSMEDDDNKLQMIDTLSDLMREIIVYSRSFTRQLDHFIQETRSVSESFDLVLREFSTISHVQVQNKLGETPALLNGEEARRSLCYILQEALNNAYRHGKASEFIISGDQNGEQFTIRFKNNGEPFEPKKTSRGLGLRTMENRVKTLGGSFQISLDESGLVMHELLFSLTKSI